MARTDQYGHDADGRKPAERAPRPRLRLLRDRREHRLPVQFLRVRHSTSSPRHWSRDGNSRPVIGRTCCCRTSSTSASASPAAGSPSATTQSSCSAARRVRLSRFEIVNPHRGGAPLRTRCPSVRAAGRASTRTHQGCFSGALKVVSPEGASAAGSGAARWHALHRASRRRRATAAADIASHEPYAGPPHRHRRRGRHRAAGALPARSSPPRSTSTATSRRSSTRCTRAPAARCSSTATWRCRSFPRIAVKLPATTLSEPGRDTVFARLQSAQASVALLPLLRRQVEIDGVRIDGLQATIVRQKDGRTNVDDLLQPQKPGVRRAARTQPSAPSGATTIGAVQLKQRRPHLARPRRGSHGAPERIRPSCRTLCAGRPDAGRSQRRD